MTDQPGYEDLDMRARYATQHFAEADEQGESADLEADIESNELHAAAGQTYHLAIDGLGGDEGTFLLQWTFDPGAPPLPVISAQPLSLSVTQLYPVVPQHEPNLAPKRHRLTQVGQEDRWLPHSYNLNAAY